MLQRFGLDAAIFSLKCFAAAMLATFVAFSIGLERPYWAFLTAYIVSGPLAGAVASRAMFRLIGTVGGATFAVFIVPPLVQSPVLLVAAMALWLGLCVFLSLLDRSPSSYMFVLAGYSAGLIVWPIVDAPTHIFDVAALRAQEIAIGITCSALIHGVILPNPVTKFLRHRTRTIVRDAEEWSRDILYPSKMGIPLACLSIRREARLEERDDLVLRHIDLSAPQSSELTALVIDFESNNPSRGEKPIAFC